MPRTSVLAVALSALCLGVGPAVPPAAAEVSAWEGTIEIPTYPWDTRVRHPLFRETDGRNIYPYPMMDGLSRVKETRRWRTVVLENEHLRVTFLPELGGKVYEVLEKGTGRPVFYVNRVVKPGLIGQCGAWVSGGIEFNTGPAGHTVSAVLPISVEILPPLPDGSRSVAVGEVERIYRTRWTVVVTLRPGRSYLEESIRIYNRTGTVRPYYFWNCTAVPDTPGFRFIYPMTLGTDHGGSVFYTWPVADGRDLSFGRNYQDASSIFAYQCDQDFFGSYDDDADRGVVACANHHVLPGKKAWTWGRGSYGRMHQMDLTDDDGPYNEVQTGPLPTQADVGRLEPHEAIAWREWWYPVSGIGGFTFATPDLAANARIEGEGAEIVLDLRLLATGTWADAETSVERNGAILGSAKSPLRPLHPVHLRFEVRDERPCEVRVRAGKRELARFRVPLDLPVRVPPGKPCEPATASEFARAGWQEFLFARFPAAEALFEKAVAADPASAEALAGLAMLRLDRSPSAAIEAADRAIAADPDRGLALLARAEAHARLEKDAEALRDAWAAARDPRVAVAARALAARILLRRGDARAAVDALEALGPWGEDPEARNLLALALLRADGVNGADGTPGAERAVSLARANLDVDPLDAFARAILWFAGKDDPTRALARLIAADAQGALELAASFQEAGEYDVAARILREFALKDAAPGADPVVLYTAAFLEGRSDRAEAADALLARARLASVEGVFPHRIETVPALEWALSKDPSDRHAAFLLAHLLFSLGRHSEARALWETAADDVELALVAQRALGLARWKLDGDAPGAKPLLEAAHRADPRDPIAAMDLVKVIQAVAEDKARGVEEGVADRTRTEAQEASLAILRDALDAGAGRSDFVALLARAQNRLGKYAETVGLLDRVRITIWEGARDVHDLFEEAHLALGREHLAEGRPVEALREFDRALEYPENLATGRLEGAKEGRIHRLRAKALEALGRGAEAKDAETRAAQSEATESGK